MAVPRHHMAKGKQLRRRSHLALKPLKLADCSQCKKKILPHLVCKYCGYYRGREVINVLAKLDKKERKAREKEMAKQEKEKAPGKELSMEALSRK